MEGAFKVKQALGHAALMLFAANCVFGFTGCGGSGEVPVAGASAPVPPPTTAPPPSPSSPAPPTFSVTVAWSVPLLNTDGTVLTDISGFRILYGTSPTNLAQSVALSEAGVTSYVVSGLTAGTYYFAVATVNSTGIASAVSNTASKTLP